MRFWASIGAAALAALLIVGGVARPAAAATFVDGFEDLPLMPSLSQQVDRTLLFDSPYGRIVEAFAAGRATPAQVAAFYGATLPQLGWTPLTATEFRREGEVLRIEFSRPAPGGATGLLVRFQIAPD